MRVKTVLEIVMEFDETKLPFLDNMADVSKKMLILSAVAQTFEKSFQSVLIQSPDMISMDVLSIEEKEDLIGG